MLKPSLKRTVPPNGGGLTEPGSSKGVLIMGKIRAYTINTESPIYKICELTSELEALQTNYTYVYLVHYRNLFDTDTQLKFVSKWVELMKTDAEFCRQVNKGLLTISEIAIACGIIPGDKWCECEHCNFA
jgi:hypothetical protein